MERILIVDGNNLLFQMFYGIPTKIYNKSKKTIHATIGFISAIQRLIKLIEASKVIVVFDDDSAKEKIDLYDDYKANRVNNWNELPEDEVPFNEEPYIFECLKYLDIKILKSKNMEADDLIASLTLSYCKDNKVFISSNDTDFYQLISENVSIIKYKGKDSKIIDCNEFFNMFNFDVSKYVFYKSLVGDSADNIKGISKIGKVRATQIVNKYADFESFFKDIDNMFSHKIATIVTLEKEKYYLNSKLITLLYRHEVNYSLELFNFNCDKILLKNSEILSACKVFD